MNLEYTIQPTDNYSNVKDVLKNHFLISDRLLAKLKKQKQFFLNSENVYISTPVATNDIISFSIEDGEENATLVPTPMELNILYEDDAFLILNKPAGIAIHPSLAHYDTSLSSGVRYYYNSIGLKQKVRIVNRLDKDTSGIVIFAKNGYFQDFLVQQMRNKSFSKKYLGITEGIWTPKSGTINLPIARKENSIIERCVKEGGDTSITHYQVLKEKDYLSLVDFSLETGRTHQIRVHSSFLSHPILGDTLYGNSSPLISRQALHSYYVSFLHPITRKTMEFTCYPDFLSLL